MFMFPIIFDTDRFLRLYYMFNCVYYNLFPICVCQFFYNEVVISTSIIKESARIATKSFLDSGMVEPYLKVTNCKAGEKM